MIQAPTLPCAATEAAHTTRHQPDQPDQLDQLDLLVRRVAVGDRAAFRCLYAFLAVSVWRAAADALPDRRHADAVTRSAFLESWHLARHHAAAPGPGARAWIAAITAVRTHDRLSNPDSSGPSGTDHDCHVRRELASLLGAGRATIRIGPASFTRIDDLDLALSRIAAAW